MQKLNTKGFSHDIALVLVVVVFAIAGVAYLVGSHADAPASNSDSRIEVLPPISTEPNDTKVATQSLNGGAISSLTHYGVAEDTNWSGYVDIGNYVKNSVTGQFSFVRGDVIVPHVVCSNDSSTTSIWVGLDGASHSSSSVEQDGIDFWCNAQGNPVTYVWSEMYPEPTKPLNVSVNPGDKLRMYVGFDSATKLYTLRVTDLSRVGSSNSTDVAYSACKVASCTNSSAEWIVERPTYLLPNNQCEIKPYNHFDSVLFSDARASIGKGNDLEPFSNFPNYAMSVWDQAVWGGMWYNSGIHPGNLEASSDPLPIPIGTSSFTVQQHGTGPVVDFNCHL